MALIKGKFIDPSVVIRQSQDPVSGDDLTRKSYVDTKSEGDAAAAQSAAESYADGAASAAQAAAESYADGVAAAAQAAAEGYADAGLALKQNSLGTGTTSQFLRGDLTWQEIVTTVALAQEVFVAKNGSDASGTGTLDKPFASISAALASITDASATKRYVIKVAAGNYTEAAVALKANVFIIGESKESVRITGAVSMHSSFSGSADNRSGFSMVTLLSAADFNWATVTSAAGKLYMNETVFASTVNMYGHNNAIAQAQFDSCVIFGNLTISGINVGVFTNNIAYGNITLNQHPNGGMASILAATGGSCSGTVRFNTTVSDFGRRSAGFLKGLNCENLIIDGPSSYADVDLISQGKSSTQKLNGGTLVALNPRVNHDLETQMLKPIATNSHNLGDWGKQYMFNFAYVQGSSGTDLYLISTMGSYDPSGDSSGKSVFINSDAYGLQPNVSGGNIELETAGVSGTGVRGKVQIKARELDMTSAKITSLADGVASTDAVNKGQLDSAASAAQSAAESYADGVAAAAQAAAESYADSKVEDQIVDGVSDKAPSQNAVADALSLKADASALETGPMQLIFGSPDGLTLDHSEFLTYDASIGFLLNVGGQLVTRSLAQDPADPQSIVINDKVEVFGDDGSGPAYTRIKRDYLEAKKVEAGRELSASVGYDGTDSWLGVSETTNSGNNISMIKLFPNKAQLFTVDIGLGNGPQPILPVEQYDLTTKEYVDQAIAAAVSTADQAPYKQSRVLDATDISNGYVDLARVAMPNSMMVSVSGTVQYEDEDYSLSTVGGVTRVTFLGDLTPDGDGAALVVGDKVHFHYWAPVEP